MLHRPSRTKTNDIETTPHSLRRRSNPSERQDSDIEAKPRSLRRSSAPSDRRGSNVAAPPRKYPHRSDPNELRDNDSVAPLHHLPYRSNPNERRGRDIEATSCRLYPADPPERKTAESNPHLATSRTASVQTNEESIEAHARRGVHNMHGAHESKSR